MFKEFGDFIKRGNVLDLAVAVVLGNALTRSLIHWLRILLPLYLAS